MSVREQYTNLKSIGAFSGAESFKKSSNSKKTLNEIRSELAKERSYNLHYPARKKFKKRCVYVHGIHVQYGMDLIDIRKYKKSNYNNTFILVCNGLFQ